MRRRLVRGGLALLVVATAVVGPGFRLAPLAQPAGAAPAQPAEAALAQPAGAALAQPAGAALARAAAASSAYGASKTLTRAHVAADGTTEVVDERKVTVRVDQTTGLQGRQRLRVSWTGAHPSAARAANPYGEGGMAQEYPVVILQCRGVDSASVPASQRLSPETCWTSTRQQRSQMVTERAAIWRKDRAASTGEREQKTGISPWPSAKVCPDVDFMSTHLTPFVARSGKVFPACSSETMPPEAATGASFPPAEIAAFTDLEGKGEVQYEVRSAVENESLGCSRSVRCSIVVIPIMGISCGRDAATPADEECRKPGQWTAGSSNSASLGVDAAVSPSYWWSESNWKGRFSVPLSFGLPPDACNVLDSRAPVAFYGSELLSQAALQWAPAYCLRKDRFKFQHNRMADDVAFTLMQGGGAAAAFVSRGHADEGATPVGYAPVAVTGFAVSYVVDKPGNTGEALRLRLNARLLAKLLTQSYPASYSGRQRPGLEKNPLSLNTDPEFIALNPGLDKQAREATATVLSLSESSDVIRTLTAYIAADRDAAAFVKGKADRWGMKVNPAYRAIGLPRAEWPLKDTFVPRSELECRKENPAPYLSQVAAPVSSLRKIAEAVLDAWPNVQTRCERATMSDPWKLGRIERQGVGNRFMIGIVTLGDAERFGLRTAELQTQRASGGRPARFVAPTSTALKAAVREADGGTLGKAFTLDPTTLRAEAPRAYPGTMIVYAAARLEGLAKKQAGDVAQFIEVATRRGQRVGTGNGDLPPGYLPITRTGATADLYASAQEAADAIRAQKGLPGSADEGDDKSDTPAADSPAPSAPAAPLAVPTAAATPPTKSSAVATTRAVTTAPTGDTPAPLAGIALPLLLGLAMVLGVAAPAAKQLVQRRSRR
ncbi:hypothetical protein FE697_000745 [Mumia zhuanghuii]|uniref:ABC-type phosphate transport system, substrate-binding protein n=2 Tax=Mumia TaxID=1546255 RepID=A0ABW1QT43_9ACTN|nr:MULTISPECIES: hypothetical protein [Mumia]KAA1424495.1 hypothetical protein FE697_000745 [Mumia zhuanghuii]